MRSKYWFIHNAELAEKEALCTILSSYQKLEAELSQIKGFAIKCKEEMSVAKQERMTLLHTNEAGRIRITELEKQNLDAKKKWLEALNDLNKLVRENEELKKLTTLDIDEKLWKIQDLQKEIAELKDKINILIGSNVPRLQENRTLRSKLKEAEERKCQCGEPLPSECPKCKRLWES